MKFQKIVKTDEFGDVEEYSSLDELHDIYVCDILDVALPDWKIKGILEDGTEVEIDPILDINFEWNEPEVEDYNQRIIRELKERIAELEST